MMCCLSSPISNNVNFDLTSFWCTVEVIYIYGMSGNIPVDNVKIKVYLISDIKVYLISDIKVYLISDIMIMFR